MFQIYASQAIFRLSDGLQHPGSCFIADGKHLALLNRKASDLQPEAGPEQPRICSGKFSRSGAISAGQFFLIS
jgi:hypothetical protein